MSLQDKNEEYVRLPRAWSDWTVTEMIGEGSFGTVYVVERDGEEQALKVIEVPADDGERAALLMETKTPEGAQLYLDDLVKNYGNEITTMVSLRDNQHIVRIEDHFVEKNEKKLGYRIYIRMELLTSLRDYLAGKKITEEEAIRLGMEICDALTACDAYHIIHRDIKPDNIFISEDGCFKLGDFGTARQLDLSFGTYSTKGTFSFMAPEIYKGERYNKQVDIYSLGMVLYRLLNRNRDPFIDPEKELVYYQEREEALQRRMEGDPLPSPADASENLSLVIRKACAYHAKYRYADAAAFRAALERVLQAQGEEAAGRAEESRVSDKKRVGRKQTKQQDVFSFEEEKRSLQEDREALRERTELLREGADSSRAGRKKRKKRLIAAGAVVAVAAVLLFVLVWSGVMPIGPKENIALAAPAEELGVVEAREVYDETREDLKEPLAAARELMETLSGMSMQEFDAFSDYFVNGDDELLSIFRSAYNEYPLYSHHFFTALGNYVTLEEEEICYIGITGYNIKGYTMEETEVTAGDEPMRKTLPEIEEYPWILALQQVDGEWKINAGYSRADVAFQNFRNDQTLYPESFMEAMANDYNRVRMNEANYSYLDMQAVYTGLLTWDMKYAWQDAEGNLYLTILLRNGTGADQEIGSGILRLNDKKLGMVAQAKLPLETIVAAGENEWLTFVIRHEDVAAGTKDWTDITPVMELDNDLIVYETAAEYGTEAQA